MCGPEGNMILELDEVAWHTYRCRECANSFKMMSKIPRCPKCRSDNLEIIR